MDRILLVIDDYSELVYLQTLLKKVGFDTDGIQNTRTFEEVRLAFNPDLIIASAKGKNVNGLSLMEGLKRRSGKPKAILVIPGVLAEKLEGLKLKNVESMVRSPVQPVSFLETLASVLGRDPSTLLEKYERAKLSLDPDNDNDVHLMRSSLSATPEPSDLPRDPSATDDFESVIASEEKKVSDKTLKPISRETSVTPEERNHRMQKWLRSMKPPEYDGFPRDVIKIENLKLRKEESEKDLEDLEEERRAFVRSLFKKKGF